MRCEEQVLSCVSHVSGSDTCLSYHTSHSRVALLTLLITSTSAQFPPSSLPPSLPTNTSQSHFPNHWENIICSACHFYTFLTTVLTCSNQQKLENILSINCNKFTLITITDALICWLMTQTVSHDTGWQCNVTLLCQMKLIIFIHSSSWLWHTRCHSSCDVLILFEDI